MAKPVTFPGVFVHEVADRFKALPSTAMKDRIVTEDDIQDAMQILTDTINNNFVGRHDTPQARDQIQMLIDQHLDQMRRVMPAGLEIKNARVEGDELKFDLVGFRPVKYIEQTFILEPADGVEVEKVKFEDVKKVKINMTRPNAPWSFES